MSSPTQIFDRTLLAERRRRALARSVAGADFLLRHAAEDIAERLSAVSRRFPLALDAGSLLPILAGRLVAGGRVDRVIRMDRVPAALAGPPNEGVVGDEELLPFARQSLDLVVSALALQFVNDLPGVFVQIVRALKPDGLFLGTILAGETLFELRESLTTAELELTGGAAPRVAPFAEIRTVGALLQRAGFALPVVDQDRLTVRYAGMAALIRDLRAMGATNVLIERSRKPLTRAVLGRAAAVYAKRFADPDGRVRATFDIVSLSGWAPHDSQQKPLRPGSARTRLADALGVTEKPAGEKAGR